MNKKLFAGVAALFWRKNTVKKRHLTEGCSRRFSAEFQSRNSEFFLRFLLRDVQFFPVFQSVGKNRPFGNFIVFDHRAPQCIALQRLEQTYRVSGDGHNFIDRTNGGKIIPVIRVISEKIGPNFPQFCRSGLNVVFMCLSNHCTNSCLNSSLTSNFGRITCGPYWPNPIIGVPSMTWFSML